MTTTHYETLGINPDASPVEIKRAYRDKAKSAHPDKGGNQSDFEPIVRAYEVLKDPTRRQLYDTTGQDKRTPIETAVQSLLLQIFSQMLSADHDMPFIDTACKQVTEGKTRLTEEIKKLKDRKKKLEAKREKITSIGPVNMVHMVIDGELKNITGAVANLEHEMEIGKACLAALKSYSEEWEAPPVQQMYVTMFRTGQY
jgi:curved DNA-binding protein CbpA